MKKLILMILVLILALSSIAAFADYGAVLKKGATVFAGPDLELKIGNLQKYTAVTVKTVKSGKAEISWNGKTGWLKSKYLGSPWKALLKALDKAGIETTEMTTRYVKKTCSIYDYPSTKAHKLKKVKKGKILTSCGEKDGWSLVTDDNHTFYGYVRISNLDGISGGDGSRFSLRPDPIVFYENMV